MNVTASRAWTSLVVVGLLTVPGCRPPEADAEGTDSTEVEPAPEGRSLALPVVGQEVRRGDLVLSVSTTGQVRSDAVATLRSEAAGTVDEVLVRPGSSVEQGQVLVRLDSTPFILSLEEAQTAAAADEGIQAFRRQFVEDTDQGNAMFDQMVTWTVERAWLEARETLED